MNAKVHVIAGSAAGLFYSATRPNQTKDWGSIAEWAGGTAGGALGGLLPDILEPAISSWHRSFAHSWAAGGSVIAVGSEVAECQQALRSKALEFRAQREGSKDGIKKLILAVIEALFFFLAGLVAGLIAGYISHLALDLITPRGLPAFI